MQEEDEKIMTEIRKRREKEDAEKARLKEAREKERGEERERRVS